MNRKLYALLSVLLVASFVLAACPSSAPEPAAEPAAVAEPTNTPEPAKEEAAPTEAPKEEAAPTEAPKEEAAPTEAPKEEAAPAAATEGGSALDQAMAGAFKGTTVTILGGFTDQDEVKFNDTIKSFEEATGIDIQYTGDKSFEASITTRVEGGDAPDIANFPQPGLLARFAATGKVVDVSTFIPVEKLQEQYIDAWIDMSRMTGPDGKEIIAGVWERFNGKSLVWYPKKAFDEAGYTVPTTWAELVALQDMIVSDGDTPWCIGIESSAATGWPATDWMEEFMLRTTSLENYDKWVKGELKFDSPEVKAAATAMSEIWLKDEYVYGGTKSIATTFFGDAPTPMFEDPPKCWMHKQGNFITSFFPEGKEALVDYGVFYLPGIDDAYGKPFLVAGDIEAMFNDRPEVRAVMEYFTKGEHLKGWLAAGGALSPHKDVDLAWYGSDLEREIARLAGEATSVRFDASDLMPGEVGAGSFWKGMTNYVSGITDLDATMKEIDAAWPTK